MGLLRAEIESEIAAGNLADDPAQAGAIVAFDNLLDALAAVPPSPASKKSALGWIFNRKPPTRHAPNGLYLWGGVGRGKSMLMDRFFALAPTRPKKRVHFHAFMQDVHSRIHVWRQENKDGKAKSSDPIPPLADALAVEAHLLCFDEFAVTDVADAMILARLFSALFERGVTVVATSNVQPDQLYKDGLNRSFFLPFIDLVKQRMPVLELASETDHRMAKIISRSAYFIDDDAGFEALWSQMVGAKDEVKAEVEIHGRVLNIEKAAGGVARFSFDDLCRKPLGAADYLALSERFHTFFVSDIPVMEIADRNAVKRFITFIDTLYDQGRVIVVSAAAEPSGLYPVSHGTEAFEFDRTISRLREMQGEEWLAKAR